MASALPQNRLVVPVAAGAARPRWHGVNEIAAAAEPAAQGSTAPRAVETLRLAVCLQRLKTSTGLDDYLRAALTLQGQALTNASGVAAADVLRFCDQVEPLLAQYA